MGNRSVPLILMLFLTFPILFAAGEAGGGVAAVYNESAIDGVVSEYTITSSYLVGIKPEQVLYGLTIKIESSRDTGHGPDFLHDKTGQAISFFSKEKLSPDLFGKRIRAKARYTGDERRGVYWISDIEIIK